MKIFIFSIFFFLYLINFGNAENVIVFKFDQNELSNLVVRKIKGASSETKYSIGSNENGNFLRAEVENGGSGLGKELEVDLDKTPFLNITWKVEKDLKGIIEKTKKGHDYAARVFVIKKTGFTPLSNKAINYVFSSNNSLNEHWKSPYTKNSVDYVLSTTKENFNKWVTVKTNVKDHFKKLHGLDIKKISGVAIMSDTDQSKKLAISYFQNIYFSSE